jgi:hypothetical protein
MSEVDFAEALANLPTLIKQLKIQDFLEFPGDADPEHSNEFKVQQTLEALGRLSREPKLKSITTIKPDRAPSRILADTCEGIHPAGGMTYIRKVSEIARESAQKVGLL